ncbi:V-type ATP synthase subunit F [archaeon SCG-AAA382B04]|nr:V-type ATP synthase subunit F [archaeon SCG-AAA382B04]
MDIAVVADEDTVTGFRLAGIKKTEIIEESEDLKQNLEKHKEDTGILITTERLAEKHREEVNSFKEEGNMFPILVEIPDKFGSAKETELQDLVKKAIGVEVELEDI